MTRFQRNDRAFIQQQIEESSERPTIGTVSRVNEHGAPQDDTNHEINVEVAGRDKELRCPLATGGSAETKIPKVGDTVLIEYTGTNGNLPLVTNILFTDDDRAPPGKAGMSRSIYESGYSPTGFGNINVTGYTNYDTQIADNDKDDAIARDSVFQIAKHTRSSSVVPIANDPPLRFEVYDSAKSSNDASRILLSGNKIDEDSSKSMFFQMDFKDGKATLQGTNGDDTYTIEMDVENEKVEIKGDSDSDNTMGASFNFATDEFTIADGKKFGISSDGSGNFTWSHKSINFKEESGSEGTISL